MRTRRSMQPWHSTVIRPTPYVSTRSLTKSQLRVPPGSMDLTIYRRPLIEVHADFRGGGGEWGLPFDLSWLMHLVALSRQTRVRLVHSFASGFIGQHINDLLSKISCMSIVWACSTFCHVHMRAHTWRGGVGLQRRWSDANYLMQ